MMGPAQHKSMLLRYPMSNVLITVFFLGLTESRCARFRFHVDVCLHVCTCALVIIVVNMASKHVIRSARRLCKSEGRPIRWLTYVNSSGELQTEFKRRKNKDVVDFLSKGVLANSRMSISDYDKTHARHVLTSHNKLQESLELGDDFLWLDRNVFEQVLKMTPEALGHQS